jgi:putative endonuclease
MNEPIDSIGMRSVNFRHGLIKPVLAKPVVVKPIMAKSVNDHTEKWVRLSPEESANRRGYGATYEDRARDYLSALGYQFIAQNVNFKAGEIDLIFEQNIGRKVELVFVEVRKRSGYGWVSAEESVTFPKQRTLRNAITQYLHRYRGRASSMRIDLIAFQGEVIRHYPNFIH